MSSYTLGDPNGTGSAAGALRTLTRDAAGRITGYSHTNNGATVTSLDQGFTYDNLDRLTSQTTNASSYGFTYDANGNRTSKVVSGTTYANTVASTSNRYTQTQDATGTANVQYDSAGNTTSDGTNTYAYSDRGRMSSAATSSGNVTMLYDGLERRAYKSSPLGTSYYVRDEGWNFLGEYDQNGNSVYETVYLGSTPVGVIKQGAVYNVHTDQIDTPRVITKQDHAIVWRWDTAEAFGATAPNQDPSGFGAFVFNLCMPGQVRDIETGQCDNGHRTYDARVRGGYLQPDPLGLKGGSASLYPYANGDPLSVVDPRGEFGLLGALGGAAINAGGQAAALMEFGGVDLQSAARCIDLNKVMLSAGFGLVGPTFLNGLLGKAAWSFVGGTAITAWATKRTFPLPPTTVGDSAECKCLRETAKRNMPEHLRHLWDNLGI